MSSPGSRQWTAVVVISFDDQRLNAMGFELRDEIYSVLSRVDEPEKVVAYLHYLKMQSEVWRLMQAVTDAKK